MLSEYLQRSSYAFFAYWLKDTDPKVNDTLIFTKVLLNEDGAYNNNTGEYLVPVDGIYIFSTSLCNNGGHGYVEIRFLADHNVMNIFFLGELRDYICTSTSTVGRLRKGTHVKIVVAGLGSTQGDKFICSQYNSDRMCSFSGFLIK